MAEALFAVGDIGATNSRLGVYDSDTQLIGGINYETNPSDYEGTVQYVADRIEEIAAIRGVVYAASIAVAAEVNTDGVLTRSGGLSPWIGRNLGHDLEDALGLGEGRVGTPNDVVAIALSQQHMNLLSARQARGIATTVSSGLGGALYWEAMDTKSDEPGHEPLRSGAMCPCGGEGHVEAFVSGNGIKLNHGVSAQEYLNSSPIAAQQFITDLSGAFTAMIERHREENDFDAQELRWTGGLALNQPILMGLVAEQVKYNLGGHGKTMAFDTVTMGEQAGLHGTLIDAKTRARNY